MWTYPVLMKIRDSFLCVTNKCVKITSKLILDLNFTGKLILP